MAGEDRTAADTLSLQQALHEEPWRFDFFQAVRRLECVYRHKPRIGKSLHAAEDPVRLGQQAHTTFAPATLAEFVYGKDGLPPRLEVFFLGLFGPHGPLPLHLTEYARDRLRNSNDAAFARFADLFHHRMLCLFYRAWANAQPAVSFDRPEEDRFGNYIASLMGLGMPSLRERDAMPDIAKQHFAGRISNHSKNAEGLLAILRDFFRMPVEMQEFIGQWLEIPAASRWYLGERREGGHLGLSVTLGEAVWERQFKFRIIFGALTLADYERLLPGGESLKRLVAVVRNYLGSEFAWDVNLILKKEEVPRLQLGVKGQLGWTTWLGEKKFRHDPADLNLMPRVA